MAVTWSCWGGSSTLVNTWIFFNIAHVLRVAQFWENFPLSLVVWILNCTHIHIINHWHVKIHMVQALFKISLKIYRPLASREEHFFDLLTNLFRLFLQFHNWGLIWCFLFSCWYLHWLSLLSTLAFSLLFFPFFFMLLFFVGFIFAMFAFGFFRFSFLRTQKQL